MCPQVLPRPLFNEVIDDVLDHIRPIVVEKPKYNYWITCLEDLKNRQTFQEKYEDWRDGFRRGKERLEQVDTFRGDEGKLQEIFKQNKKVLDWWNQTNMI